MIEKHENVDTVYNYLENGKYNTYKFEDIKIGMEESFQVNLTEDMMKKFLDITQDINPLHNDIEYAKSKGYNEKVVYGMLTSSFLSTLAGVYLPGKYSLIHSVEIMFKKPVFISDSPLTIKGTVSEINEDFKQIKINVSITNKKQEKVCRGIMKVGVINE